MKQYWFKPHAYGYGATPNNWKGWVAVAGFVALIMSLSLLLLLSQQNPGTGPAAWQIAAWALIVLGSTVGFIFLARAKTDGQWAWRWGK